MSTVSPKHLWKPPRRWIGMHSMKQPSPREVQTCRRCGLQRCQVRVMCTIEAMHARFFALPVLHENHYAYGVRRKGAKRWRFVWSTGTIDCIRRAK